jgi:hypothetical protein
MQKYKQLGTEDNVNLKLILQRNITENTLCYGAELWGFHGDGAAERQRTELEKIYHQQLRSICGVKHAVPAEILLWELGLLSLRAQWWRLTVRFWNKIATLDCLSFQRDILLDNIRDSQQRGVKNYTTSLYKALLDLGLAAPQGWTAVPELDEKVVMQAVLVSQPPAWTDVAPCPRQCPSVGAKRCLYHHWFMRPPDVKFNKSYLSLPLPAATMRQLVRFRVGSHRLPVELGRQHGIPRHQRTCTSCTGDAVCDEQHVVFECPAVQFLRDQYADLFTPQTQTMCTFMWQPRHRAVASFLSRMLKMFENHDTEYAA